MKKILFTIAVALLLAACNGVQEEVVTTYSDGTPELVYLVKGKDESKKIVGEKRYYSNGEKHSVIHFGDDQTTPTGIWEYYYPTGHLFAKANMERGERWNFYADGQQNAFLDQPFDSVRTAQMGEKRLPVEVHAMRADTTWVFRFYEDFLTQSQGIMINDQRQGKWVFYHPNGKVQVEALFVEGVENGAYNIYRESGIPLIRGFYINGQRAGVWEFYDPEGNLSGRNNYDAQ